MYKNLVLSGGSSKGYSYIGVLKALEENDKMKNIETFLGTSVGSIFASLFSMGFKTEELKEYMNEKFEIQDINIEYLLETYGVCSGDEIMNYVGNVIEKKYKRDITFKELNFLRNNKLIICVTDLNRHKLEYLSYENYPDLKIIDAIRFAITLPYIFKVKKYENRVFMDAGLIQNISFYNFDPKETLGIMLMDENDKVEECKIESIEDFTKNLFICLKKNYINRVDEKYQIIEVVCKNIDVLDFSLNIEKRNYLLNCGYNTTNNYLKNFKK